MKTLLFRFEKPIYIVVGIMFLVLLTACNATGDVSVADVQQTQTETVVPKNSQTSTVELPSFVITRVI